MNTLKVKKREQKKFNIIILLISFLLMILSLIIKLFIENEIEEKYTLKLISLIPNDLQIPFSNVVDYLDSINPILILAISIYCIRNTYKSFILFNIPCIICYIISLLKIIFLTPRRTTIQSVLLSYGFSFPNYHIIIIVTSYFSMWYIFFYGYNKEHCLSKFLSFCSMNIFFFVIMLGQIVGGMHYVFENILSFLFSYSFCVFILFGFNLKLDDSKEFEKIINFNIIYYLLMYVFSFIILLFSYMKRIDKFEGIKDISEKENNIFLLNQSFIVSTYFYGSFFSIFAIKSEIYFIFEGKYNFWEQCNFPFTEDNNSSNVNIIKDKIWNSTSLKKTILRILYFIFCSYIIILPFYLFCDTEKITNLYYNYLIFSLESALLMYCIFFFFKIIIRKKESLVNDLFFEGFEEKPLL